MDQQTALSILKTGQNIYLTGSAGTGKTYLIKQYIEYLRERQVPLAVTASTGIAATHIGGQTVHSWSGVGVRESVSKKDLEKIGRNPKTVKRIRNAQVLIIDEISMISGKVLAAISDILKHFKKSPEAFGGAQVLLSGDFFQLPPVSKQQADNREKFAFMAPVWVEAKLRVCYLKRQYRQGRDTLSFVLSEIRSQDISDDTLGLFREKLKANEAKSEALKLYTHNADVDATNAKKLEENTNPIKSFYAELKGQDKILEGLKQSVLAGPAIQLKKNARVMFVKNNPEKGYFNGSTGTVAGFDEDEGFPIVEMDNGKTLVVKPEEWTIEDEEETILASYKQIPLRLAWAITVHKSQGMTLDAAEIDLSKTFEAGQGYVALSRLKDWGGLALKGINQTALQLDALAVKADKRFKELSEESEDWLNGHDDEELNSAYLDFIDARGGTNDEEVIEQNKTRAKKYYEKPKKETTCEKTKHLILAGKGLGEIAMERDLSMGTIIGHIEKILKDNKGLDISRFKPDDRTFAKVQKAADKIKAHPEEEYFDKDGNIRLGYIYGALNGAVDYDTIRLARLFID